MTVRAQPLKVGVRFEEAYTSSPGFAVLEECKDSEGGTWVFGQAGEALDAGALCRIDNTGQVFELNTTDSGAGPINCCIPQVAVANDEYVWCWRGPGGGDSAGISALITDSITAGAALTTTATDGVLGAGGDTVIGLTGVDTTAGSGGPHLTEVYASTLIATNT